MANKSIKIYDPKNDPELEQYEEYQREFWAFHLADDRKIVFVDDNDEIIWPFKTKMFLFLYVGCMSIYVIQSFVSFFNYITSAGQLDAWRVIFTVLSISFLVCSLVCGFFLYSKKTKIAFCSAVLTLILAGLFQIDLIWVNLFICVLFAIALSQYYVLLNNRIPAMVPKGIPRKVIKKICKITQKIIDKFSF